jgi:hypothetical protein
MGEILALTWLHICVLIRQFARLPTLLEPVSEWVQRADTITTSRGDTTPPRPLPAFFCICRLANSSRTKDYPICIFSWHPFSKDKV